MPAPFPYNAIAGVPNELAESEAENLVAQYTWLARWSNEMNADTELNRKKFAQFIFHCFKYRFWFDQLALRDTQIRNAALQGAFGRRRMTWGNQAQMLTDLQAIYDAAGVFYNFAVTNMQQARQFTTAEFDINFQNQTDVAITEPKSAAIATRISQFRGLFS